MSFPIHTLETAPADSRPILAGAKQSLGFVPNLFGAFAEAPALLEAYTALGPIFDRASLSPTERQVVLLSASTTNGCTYCVAAHSTIAAGQKVDAAVIEALRAGAPIADAKLEALRTFTRRVVETRAELEPSDVAAFLAAGYGRAQVLEVILGVGLKTLSNYTNHLVDTPLDAAFEKNAWEPVGAAR